MNLAGSAVRDRSDVMLVGAVVVIVVCLGALGWWLASEQRQQTMQQAEENLLTIWKGRSAEIANWMKERRGDGLQVKAQSILYDYLDSPEDPHIRSDVTRWLDSMLQSYGYQALIYLAEDFTILAESPTGAHDRFVDRATLDPAVFRAEHIQVTDLHRSIADHSIHFTVLVPIAGKVGDDNSAKGLVLMVMDPEYFLYPTLGHWPVPSESSETLLVRRDGDEVVFVSELRHRGDAALNVRFPLGRSDLPAAQSFSLQDVAVSGGEDYRGVPVLAARGPVPETPWHMVVKTDVDEVLTPYFNSLRELVMQLGLVGLVLCLSAILVQRRVRWQQTELELARRRESESATQDAALRMRLATEATGLGIWEWEIAHRVMHWDKQMFRLYGIEPTPDLVIRYEDWKATVHPEDVAKREAALSRARVGQTGDAIEFRIYRSDDRELRFLTATETLHRDDEGVADLVIGTTVDITDRKRAELAQRDSEERVRLATEAAGIGVWEMNVRTGEVRWDEKISEMYGMDLGFRSDASLQNRMEVVFPADRAGVEQAIQAVIVTQETSYQEFRINRVNDGELRFIQAANSVRLDTAGEVEWVVGTNRDITEQLKADNEIKRLSTVVEQSPVSIVITDLQGNIEYTNPFFSTATGYSAAEAKGKNPRVLKSGKIPRETYENLWSAITAGRTWRGLLQNRRKEGELFWEDAVISPLLDSRDHVTGYLGIKTDVTQRIRSEQKIRELNENLENRVTQRTQELEMANQELESFSYSVSHDLRAPLRAIDGWAQVLLDDFGATLQDDGVEALDRLRAAAQRMGTLIDDLLRLSRVNREPVEAFPVRMETLVEEVVADLLRGELQKVPTLTMGRLPDATGTSSLLRQVWANLIGNAFKFSAKTEVPAVEIGSTTDADGTVTYYVKDNGAGFDMRYAAKLFTAFQRLHSPRDYPGSGIGLALTQRIVRRHGGRVWAEGALGEGARFYFTINANPSTGAD